MEDAGKVEEEEEDEEDEEDSVPLSIPAFPTDTPREYHRPLWRKNWRVPDGAACSRQVRPIPGSYCINRLETSPPPPIVRMSQATADRFIQYGTPESFYTVRKRMPPT